MRDASTACAGGYWGSHWSLNCQLRYGQGGGERQPALEVDERRPLPPESIEMSAQDDRSLENDLSDAEES